MFKQFHLFANKREMSYEEYDNWLNKIKDEINDGVVLLPNHITYEGVQSPNYITVDGEYGCPSEYNIKG